MMSESELPETPAQETHEAPKADEPKAKPAKKAKAEKHEPSTPFKVGESGILTAAQKKKIVLVEDESDPLWDPKMKLGIPDEIVKAFKDPQFGWDPSMPLRILPDGRIAQGRTKWRAALKVGLESLDIPFVVAKEQDEITSMRVGVRLNEHVQKIDPMTRAESIVRALSAGLDEKDVASDHGISVNDLHGYLLLTDEEKCPPKVQELLREGQISFAAALELARRAENMTKGEIAQAAEQVAKVAAGGVKVTAAQVKKAAGAKDEQPATQKEKKQFILNLQSMKLAGKHGPLVQWAAIVAMEVGLGTRTVDSAIEALDKIAHGKIPRIDFKQYQTDGGPVKGQEK